MEYKKSEININPIDEEIMSNVYITRKYSTKMNIIKPTLKYGVTEKNVAKDDKPINLGDGKMFKLPIDNKMWRDINEIKMK